MADIAQRIDRRRDSAEVEGPLRLSADLQVDSGHIRVIRSPAERERMGAACEILRVFHRIVVGIQSYPGERRTDISGILTALGHALGFHSRSRAAASATSAARAATVRSDRPAGACRDHAGTQPAAFEVLRDLRYRLKRGLVLVVHQDHVAVLHSAHGSDDLGGGRAVPILGVNVPDHFGKAVLGFDGLQRCIRLAVRRTEQLRRGPGGRLYRLLRPRDLRRHLRAAQCRHVRVRIRVVADPHAGGYLIPHQRRVILRVLPKVEHRCAQAGLLQRIEQIRRVARIGSIVERQAYVAIRTVGIGSTGARHQLNGEQRAEERQRDCSF